MVYLKYNWVFYISPGSSHLECINSKAGSAGMWLQRLARTLWREWGWELGWGANLWAGPSPQSGEEVNGPMPWPLWITSLCPGQHAGCHFGSPCAVGFGTQLNFFQQWCWASEIKWNGKNGLTGHVGVLFRVSWKGPQYWCLPSLAGHVRKAEGTPGLHANVKDLWLLGPNEFRPREAVDGPQREIFPDTPNWFKGG